jgi:predicted helicase
MTATERIFRGDREDVLSMDNEKNYGPRFFQLSFKEAIKQRIIADYKILTITVSDRHIRRLGRLGTGKVPPWISILQEGSRIRPRSRVED